MRVFSIVCLATLLFATAAHAQNAGPPPIGFVSSAPAPSLTGPSVWGILPWGGFGVGARLMIPLGIQPLLVNTPVRDSFAVEVGADLLHWSYSYAFPGVTGFSYSWTEVLPVAGIMWNVWLNEQFALYPKLELGYAFGWVSGWEGMAGLSQPAYGGFFWDGAGGAMYRLAGGVTLRAEVGYAGLKLGAGWLF